ncbi:MAG: hypothetical protein LIO92_09385, partial [Clostridiales bacterium]|nr:hypothetical protein [Clostridiales bacterium]
NADNILILYVNRNCHKIYSIPHLLKKYSRNFKKVLTTEWDTILPRPLFRRVSKTTPLDGGRNCIQIKRQKNGWNRQFTVAYRSEHGNCIEFPFQSAGVPIVLWKNPQTPIKLTERTDVMNEVKIKIWLSVSAKKRKISLSEMLKNTVFPYRNT